MDISWIKSPVGRHLLELWADPRPSWLWTADGQALIWRNMAARFFQGRTRKRDSEAPSEVTPIRGQVARLIRLGSPNRASLSRMQFLAGETPVSATCSCTPLTLPDGNLALLVVGVDPIGPDQLDSSAARDRALEGLFPAGSEYLLVDDDDQIGGGTPMALERYAPALESQGLPETDESGSGILKIENGEVGFTRFKASPQDAVLLLFDGEASARPPSAPLAGAEAEASEEPLLPMGLPPLPSEPEAPAAEEVTQPAPVGLTSLFDRLRDDGALFTPLRPDEDFAPPARPAAIESEAAGGDETAPTAVGQAPGEAPELEPADEPAHAEPAAADAESETDAGAVQYRVVASQFTPLAEPAAAQVETGSAPAEAVALVAEAALGAEATIGSEGVEPVPPAALSEAKPDDTAYREDEPAGGAESPELAAQTINGETLLAENAEEPLRIEGKDGATPEGQSAALSEEAAGAGAPQASEDMFKPVEAEPEAEAPDAESVERVSRYNFDELSRILTDRVGRGESEPAAMPHRTAASMPSATPTGELVTLGGETLVLNRLPLGILVFRDQKLLFANRAITGMTGYDSVEALREAGLGAIFPAAGGDDKQEAGPVNHLVRRDGALLPVTARLQSVSWQGKPALMLSASATEVRTGHEAAVRAFAEHVASERRDGFIEANRAGVVTGASADARLILGREEDQLIGRPLSAVISPSEVPALRSFLERPARFAETARPAITLRGADPQIELLLFAQGQAGIVSTYFGFVRRLGGGHPALPPPSDSDPALLGRLSRGVRRPLNTVIGFSDLIGSAAFGRIDNERYVEYARDIKSAGQEIAALVDELDDFARLRDGRYVPNPIELDLAALLESSVARVRNLANAGRVLVRTAISERLPHVRADRPSLAQAVLNLLASAIDQTPQDGSVVLSAQLDALGQVVVKLRDSAHGAVDLGERFVVFRDGVRRGGEPLTPIRSSVGLALTQALLAINHATLDVDPTASAGTLFSVTIAAEHVIEIRQLPPGPSPAGE